MIVVNTQDIELLDSLFDLLSPSVMGPSASSLE